MEVTISKHFRGYDGHMDSASNIRSDECIPINTFIVRNCTEMQLIYHYMTNVNNETINACPKKQHVTSQMLMFLNIYDQINEGIYSLVLVV